MCQRWFDEVRDKKRKKVLIFSFTGDRDVIRLLAPLASSPEGWDIVIFVDNTVRTTLTTDESNWAIRQNNTEKAVQDRLTLMLTSWQTLTAEITELPQRKTTMLIKEQYIEDAFRKVATAGSVDCLVTGSLLFVGNCLKIIKRISELKEEE